MLTANDAVILILNDRAQQDRHWRPARADGRGREDAAPPGRISNEPGASPDTSGNNSRTRVAARIPLGVFICPILLRLAARIAPTREAVFSLQRRLEGATSERPRVRHVEPA
jgi:hypothetical protein